MLCWGNASFGQLGLGGIDEEIVLEPRKSDFFLNKRIRDVGCGLRHTVFVLDDGTVYTCGCNDLGQLGHEKARKRPGKLRRNELQSIPVFECVFSLCDAASSPRLSVLVCVLNCMHSSSSKIGHVFNRKNIPLLGLRGHVPVFLPVQLAFSVFSSFSVFSVELLYLRL